MTQVRYMLVDHPALPLPAVGASGITRQRVEAISEASVGKKERHLWAAQTLALCSLLNELEMWLPRWAIRNSVVRETGAGRQVVAGGFPVSLSRTYNRLGGGERAARVMSDEVVAAVCARFRVAVPGLQDDPAVPGFFLDTALHSVLGELRMPFDQKLAANLWAVRYDGLPLPEDGEISYVSLPDRETSLRLGAALCCSLRGRGRQAWLRDVSSDDGATAPFPSLGERGTLILAGNLSDEEILSVERWVQLEGCSACVAGVFPNGWRSSPRCHDLSRLNPQLVVVGGKKTHCRQVIEDHEGREHLGTAVHQVALTERARHRFIPLQTLSPTDSGKVGQRVYRLLSLLPAGLPEGLISCHAEMAGSELNEIMNTLPVVRNEGTWRLVQTPLLVCDELHHEVSGLFADDDPRRLRHEALAGNDRGELKGWVRERMDALDTAAVRANLSVVSPGALGTEIQHLMIEACLADSDPAAARAEAVNLPETLRLPLNAWINSIDVPRGWSCETGDFLELARVPAAAAEVACFLLRKARNSSSGDVTEARALLKNAVQEMRGLQKRWYEIEAASLLEPKTLFDKSWQKRIVAEDTKLDELLTHKQALYYRKNNEMEKAEELLTRLAAEVTIPGRLAMVFYDLSEVEMARGREREGVWWLLKAQRLFESKGFQHRLRDVAFNLAVADIDHLKLDLAEHRLEFAGGSDKDVFVALELSRLALARGEEDQFNEQLELASSLANPKEKRVNEALDLLKGVRFLLRGELTAACNALTSGGDEGKSWLDIIDALDGKEPGDRADHWGLNTAAKRIFALRSGQADPHVHDDMEIDRKDQAMALALTARLVGQEISGEQKRRACQLLERHGMKGWARCLRADSGFSEGFARGLITLLEDRNPGADPPDVAPEILRETGISGIELRSRNGEMIWKVGHGKSHEGHVLGRNLLVPLGGDPGDGPAWRLLSRVLEATMPVVPQAEDPEVSRTGILGVSDPARSLRTELMSFAPNDATVLLLGETGVGKEVAALALHNLSGRSGQFQAVNIAAASENLIEAELFGAVRGAYTGADRSRKGVVEAADGGTLFLDEIGDLGMPMQVKLLRFLESREVRPVGSDHSHIVDVRIVAATHRNLERRMQNGSFREDLYYRISVAPVTIPPLRDRVDDILLLRDHFEREFCARNGLQLCRWSREADASLKLYDWPGNIRQLKNTVEGAVLRSRGATIQPETLKIGAVAPSKKAQGTWEEVQAVFRRQYLSEALSRNNGNRSATARELGISRQALLYQIRGLGLT